MNSKRLFAIAMLAFALAGTASYAQPASAQLTEDSSAGPGGSSGGRERGRNTMPQLVINGTKNSASFMVNADNLGGKDGIAITAPAGFTVSPASLPPTAKGAKVTVTLNSYKTVTSGNVVLRSGANRSFIKVKGYGSPLTTKNIATNPVYGGGTAATFAKTTKDGFKPSDKGYTIEYKVKADKATKEFTFYTVDANGIGFKAYSNAGGMGIYSAASKKAFSNPATSVDGGLGKFYNEDNPYHVYRYAVTPDNRVIVYRDGLLIDSLRAADYGTQPEFAGVIADPVENLLKNPGFEADFDTKYDNHIAVGIEGWNVLIGDRYNSEQFIVNQEINNEQDFNNHILQMKRYKWADGWGAAEVEQLIDVAPNESYTLSALVRGGIEKKEGKLLGKMRIEEVQDHSLRASVDIASKDWETYSLDYTTSAACKQLRVVFYLERDKWGANIDPLDIDNVKLTGKGMKYTPKIGFDNKGVNLEYFTYDLTGAYAPANSPKIEIVVPGAPTLVGAARRN